MARSHGSVIASRVTTVPVEQRIVPLVEVGGVEVERLGDRFETSLLLDQVQ
jgi:hypothetical protein